jgi:2-oxoacid:acceptor oxidoreductase gamma subunit (pyruvate/2-ketoisovalerate family)
LIGNGIIEITFHGRGGQTAVTASQLLAELAFEKGFKDVISIPLIGAERRGSPVMSFTKISEDKEIKTYDSVKNPDFILIFDISLLDIPRIRDTIKEGVTLIVNSDKPLDSNTFPKNIKIYFVDATGICISNDFMSSSGPVLDIPMLGAFGAVTGYYNLEVMEKVIKREFGEKKLEKNMNVARDAYNSIKEVYCD